MKISKLLREETRDAMFGPIREGSRGGRDQFSWDEIKQNKHRENYLGNSVCAPVGRWLKSRPDIYWYTKDGAQDDSVAKELALVKKKEQDAMAIALGGKPEKAPETKVDEMEIRKLMQEDEGGQEIEKSEGLGFQSKRFQPQIKGENTFVKDSKRSLETPSVKIESTNTTEILEPEKALKKKRKHKDKTGEEKKEKSDKKRKHRKSTEDNSHDNSQQATGESKRSKSSKKSKREARSSSPPRKRSKD